MSPGIELRVDSLGIPIWEHIHVTKIDIDNKGGGVEVPGSECSDAEKAASITYDAATRKMVFTADGLTAVRKAISDKNGIARIRAIPAGHYILRETAAPENFIADHKSYPVVVTQEADGTSTTSVDSGSNEITIVNHADAAAGDVPKGGLPDRSSDSESLGEPGTQGWKGMPMTGEDSLDATTAGLVMILLSLTLGGLAFADRMIRRKEKNTEKQTHLS